jgi:lipoprotein-anchoring transpeptidase ErfK/SrfK
MEKQNNRLVTWLLHSLGVQPELVRTLPEAAYVAPAPAVPFTPPKHHILVLLIVGGLIGLVLAWWALSLAFMRVQVGPASYPARLSDKVLAAKVEQIADKYTLAVKYPDRTEQKYSLADMGMKPNTTSTVTTIRSMQRTFTHQLLWWRPVKATVAISVDSVKLNDFIVKHITTTVQPAKDATLTIEKGEIKLTDASAGKQYGLQNPTQALLSAASHLQKPQVEVREIALNPALTADQLESSKAELEKTLKQPITFTIAGRTIHPASSDIASWLELTPDEKAKSVSIDVNSGKVLEYINKIAKADVHPPRARVQIKQDDGTYRVLVNGVSGSDVTNKQAVATSVANSLLKNVGIEQALSVSYAGYKTITAGDYAKWIEVDLTNKRMYAYTHADLLKSFLVSAGAPKTPTVTGQYAIYSKYTQKDMRGRNVDGSKYFQPHVPWVNFFYKDYAIHGNYWRPLSYFGNINSSHGCVSTVPSEAEWVYNWAPLGTPVIVHT